MKAAAAVEFIDQIAGDIEAPNRELSGWAKERQGSLTKPRGSLGRLEELSIQLASITGERQPQTRPRSLILAAADHGITTEGVSAYPREVTAQMVRNFAAGGAAVNVLGRQTDTRVVVLDVGVAGPALNGPNIVSRRVRSGTVSFLAGPALSVDEATKAIRAGYETAAAELECGARILVTGDMGIGNTTIASALTAALLNLPASAVTGPGAGLDNEGVSRKIAVIERGLARHDARSLPPLDVLACVGGLEIAALVGVIIAGARNRVPVLIDGFVSGAAALVATRMAPGCLPYLVAGHLSVEPGHRRILDALGLHPLLNLDMRLGEGTGALLALHLLDAAASLLNDMATFEQAGVSDRGSAH